MRRGPVEGSPFHKLMNHSQESMIPSHFTHELMHFDTFFLFHLTHLMKEKERLEEVKRKHCSIVQCIPHDKMLQRITESYSSPR